MKNMINWRSNAKEKGAFFQMIGEISDCKIQYFITRMRGDSKFTLKVVSKEQTPSLYFSSIEEAQQFSQIHFSNL